MNTPRMKEAWESPSRTADGFYSTTTPMSVYARSCYEEGCKLENELATVTAQRDRLADALRRAEKTMKDRAYADYERYNPLDYDKCLIWVEATIREVRKEIEEASNVNVDASPPLTPQDHAKR
jgi:hypothetical protein